MVLQPRERAARSGRRRPAGHVAAAAAPATNRNGETTERDTAAGCKNKWASDGRRGLVPPRSKNKWASQKQNQRRPTIINQIAAQTAGLKKGEK